MISRILISFSLLLVSIQAHARLEILITEGVNSARPIAVVPFKWLGSGKSPKNFSQIISDDLRRSGQFNPISVAKMPKTP